MNEVPTILIIDDEELALANLEHILKKQSYNILTANSGSRGIKLIQSGDFDVVLTDLRMPKIDGMRILEEAKSKNPDSEVIMITGYATVDSAIEAMKKGAYHYIAKPFRIEEVRKVVSEAVEKIRLREENLKLKKDLDKIRGSSATKIITKDHAMIKVLQTAKQIAQSDCNVIISGESGTGKELLARFIHEHSKRNSGPFIAVNCGVFSEELLTSELFGHEKGAFTGALSMKSGIIEIAAGGTLFLDEITEMTTNMQVKLLRVIQERQLMRVGGTKSIKINVRFLAATNRNIQEAVKMNEFRKDLYYRLNVVSLELPALAMRKNDIPLLSQYFLEKHSKFMGVDQPQISKEAMEILKDYDYPGNVRELENIIERGIALTTNNAITPDNLPDDIRELHIKTYRKKAGKLPTLEEQEIDYIRQVLAETNGNKSLAAETLGIDRVSLWRKIKRYELE